MDSVPSALSWLVTSPWLLLFLCKQKGSTPRERVRVVRGAELEKTLPANVVRGRLTNICRKGLEVRTLAAETTRVPHVGMCQC